MTNHDQLRDALTKIHYPPGMVECSGDYCAIKGQSFFPGGKGHTGSDLPIGGLMYLGHNFDKVSGFQDSVSRGIEENLTWRKIREGVLPVLPERQIWFTNYFMGLQDGPTNVGELTRTEGFEQYEEDCWEFFCLQATLQKPRTIAVLGAAVVSVLGAANRLNVPAWITNTGKPFGHLRLSKHQRSLEYKGNQHKFELVAVYHPAYGRSKKQLSSLVEDSTFLSQ
jgi:hypothetical protein